MAANELNAHSFLQVWYAAMQSLNGSLAITSYPRIKVQSPCCSACLCRVKRTCLLICLCLLVALRHNLGNRSGLLFEAPDCWACLLSLSCTSMWIFWHNLWNIGWIGSCIQWLAFRDGGKDSAADYARTASEKTSRARSQGAWNPYEKEQMMKRRRNFVIKILQGTMKGLAFMHDNDRLHQSLGPSSIVLKYAPLKLSESDITNLSQ